VTTDTARAVKTLAGSACDPRRAPAFFRETMTRLLCAISLTLFACAPQSTDATRGALGVDDCTQRCDAKGIACGYPQDAVAARCDQACSTGLTDDQLACIEGLACASLPDAASLCTPAPSCQDRCVAKGTACGYPVDLVTTECAAGCAATPGEIGCVEQLACDQLPQAQQLCATANACEARCTAKGIGCGYPQDLVGARCTSACETGLTEARLECVEHLACSALPDADARCGS
jgi:hypothetical protein